MDDMDNDYESHKVNPDGQPADAKSVDSALTGAQALEEKEDLNDVSDETLRFKRRKINPKNAAAIILGGGA
nr:1-phosphatidylinositol-3-phosphate 5-kinase FAB1B-like [Tanacetum cinerariifolium]